MRSAAKDTTRYVTLPAIIHVAGGADQTGHFADGTPWRSIRASVGQYDIFFDPRLQPFSAFVGAIDQARNFHYITVLLPGWVHVRVMFQDTTQNDANFDLNINCIDTRV
jgi:hypothetical protein